MHHGQPASTVAERIDALLPQTQCTRCGYPACRDYADAIANGEADINQCPPGGQAGIDALAELLYRASKGLNPSNGVEKPRAIAFIDEDVCIGCTKCIQACPVDAILGASKLMHTIISDECNGCELCIPPCPVDCIYLNATSDQPDPRDVVMQHAAHYRQRYETRRARLARWDAEREAELTARKRALDSAGANGVQAALQRARERKAGRRA